MGKTEEGLLTAIMEEPLRFPGKVSGGIKEIIEGMLTINEMNRLSFEEVRKLIELEERREEMLEGRSYHWSVVKELMLIEANWLARKKFKADYDQLLGEKRKEIKAEMSCLLREEDQYMLSFLP